MRKAEVTVGACYVAKVSSVLTVVKIVAENPYGGWNAVNTKTGKPVRIRTAAKLRRSVSQGS